uniref:Centromere/kinetochore protein zw10 homolog n=1 Tax=Meloidogyne javanica TaxID=6303 RepID=A0A915MVP1_MELJA
MDKELKEVNEQISKLTNEVAKDFEMKYRDCIPDFLVLADCQDKIKKSIAYGDEQLKLIEDQISIVEKTLDTSKNDCPDAKKNIIEDFLKRLATLSEIENCLTALSLLPDCLEVDVLSNVRMILRLDELTKALESETTNMEAVNERILPLLSMEIQTRKTEIIHQLDEFFKSFLKFEDKNRVLPATMLMGIYCPKTNAASDNFTAMLLLNTFSAHLDSFVDSVWEQFCMKLIYSDEKIDQILKITKDKFSEHSMNFEVKKDVKTTKKPDPKNVFSSLTTFFESLYQALGKIRIEGRPFTEFFGECICVRLISALEKGCLNPAIPFDKDKATIVYGELNTLITEFLQFMKDKAFFTPSADVLFEKFFSSFDRITIDRRCHHYITTARELIKKPYVGSSTDDSEEGAAEIVAKMNERLKITSEQPHQSKDVHWDKDHTKIYQFHKCKISVSTFDLVNLVIEILKSASDSTTDPEACRLVNTARNVLDMFVNTASDYHMKALTSVPQIAAVFFNNCHYICHRLMTLPVDIMQSMLKISKISQENCSFTDMFTELRTLGAKTLEIHIIHSRRSISSTIGEVDIFVNLRDDKQHKHCIKILQSCILQIQQIANVWVEVMPKFVLAQSVGAIVSHLLAILSDFILSKEDIASMDAEIIADLLESLADECRKILMIDDKPMIQKVCEESYYMLIEIIFCLKSNLSEIGHRWCQGKGPLATWLTPHQVKQLIRALFQNTEKRAQLLTQIN